MAHSLVAERQVRFAAELRRQLQADGGDLLEVYPRDWPGHHRDGGWDVYKPGDIAGFLFPQETWRAIEKWRPDVVLIQQEAWSNCAFDTLVWSLRTKVPYVTFSWENVKPPGARGSTVLENARANVFGNTRGAHLAAEVLGKTAPASYIHPQVGVDPVLFQPVDTTREYDIVFVGRDGPMKGKSVLEAATRGMPWRVLWTGQHGSRTAYEGMPKVYRKAAVHCVPSIDLPNGPIEQFAPYAAIESLLCGVPVVTTDASAVKEWLAECPAAWFVRQGDTDALHTGLNRVLNGPGRFLGTKGREWASKRFTNETVASGWVRILREALS